MPENAPGIYEDRCKTRANYVSIAKVHTDGQHRLQITTQ